MPREVTYKTQIELGARKNSSFQRSLKSAASQLDRIDQKATRLGKAMITAGAAVTTGLAVAAKSAAETYKGFESEMAVVAGITQATKAEYNQLEQAALDAGSKTVYTAQESASALEYMSLAGWDVQESTTALMPVLRMATATGKELGTTSDLITDSMGALKLGINDLTPYMDKLISANNYSNTTAEQLMQALIKTGGAARTVGVDLDDTITALGILANNGTKAEEAGTATNSMLTRLVSNSTAVDTLDKIGVSIWDTKGKFIGLKETLEDINDAIKDYSDEDKATTIAAISGTHRYSQMSYLLNAVKKDTKTGTSAWDELEKKVEDSNGSLDKMYKTTTNTLENAEKMLNSAKDDMQIKITDVYADNARDFISWLAESLPNATADLVDFAETYQGDFVDIVEGAENTIQVVWENAFQALNWIAENRTAVGGALKGIAGGIIAIKAASTGVKIASTISQLSKLGGGFGGAFAGGTAAISLAITAYEAISGAIENAERKAAESSLEEHFGNIKLSMEEIDELAKEIIGKETVEGAEALAEAISQTSDSLDTVKDSLSQTEKTSWKINVGYEMTKDDFQSYGTEIQNYIKSAEQYAEDRGYQVHLSAALLFGDGSEEDNELSDAYTGAQKQLEKLGTKLYDYLYNETNGALLDGAIDVDEDKVIRELQGKMQNIVDALSDSKIQASFDAIEAKYTGSDLTPDTIKQLNKDLDKQADTVEEQAQNAFQAIMEGYDYKKSTDKSYTDEEYLADKLTAQQSYYEKVADARTKAVSYMMESVKGAYPELEELNNKSTEITEKYTNISNPDVKKMWMENDTLTTIGNAATEIQDEYNKLLSTHDKNAIAKLYEEIKPQIEDLEKQALEYAEAGKQIPESMEQTLEYARTMQGIAEGYQGASSAIFNSIMTDEDFKSFFETVDYGISKSYFEIGENAKKMFSKGYDIDTDLRVKLNVNTTTTGLENYSTQLYNAAYYVDHAKPNIDTSSELYKLVANGGKDKSKKTDVPVAKNALGGIYDSPLLTTFAEEGPEAAIPLDGTPRAKSLWMQAGTMLGMYKSQNRDSQIVSGIEKTSTSIPNTQTSGEQVVKIVYSPNVVIKGSAKQEDVQKALKLNEKELEQMMDRITKKRTRRKFGGK